VFRATKGIGRTQPLKWKDAGDALGHEELKGCLMPDGTFAVRLVELATDQHLGSLGDANDNKAYLQYNEVRFLSFLSRVDD
jgi:hypothetical protein